MSSRNIRLVIVVVALAAALAWASASFFLRKGTPVTVPERAAVFPAPAPERNGVRGGSPPRGLEAVSTTAAAAAPPLALASGEVPASVPARRSFASAWGRERQPALMAFDAWAGRYLAAPPDARRALAAEGVTLALARRGALADLIKTDPQRAIAAAVPLAVRAQLPPEIAAYLEERVAGTGNLELLAITPAPGQAVAEPSIKRATVDGRIFRAYTYGRRESQATKVETSVLGVALDGTLAVSESPLRVLEKGEVPAPGVPVAAACPMSGKLTAVPARAPLNVQAAVAVQVGGQVQVLCHSDHVAEYEARWIQQETAAGPYPVQLSLNNESSGTSNVTGRPPLSWSQGTKKVLFIRVDFSDLPGTPLVTGTSQEIDDTFAVNQINQANGVRDFYLQGSYGKTTLAVAPVVSGDSPDVTIVYRLPKKASYYAAADAGDGEMHTAAETLASDGGYILTDYHRIGVVFSNLNNQPNSKITYGGRANVQGKNFWINGYFNFGTLIHELGHTYGLQHSNLWQVSDGNPVSPAGTSVEYGDPYDPMGSNNVTVANHFNQWEKSLLQWIPDTAVTTVTTAGSYRVYRFDHPSANLSNPLALKIVRNNAQDYWIGHRRALNNPALLDGAHILWGYNAVQQSNLLDFTTPGTTPADSPLAVGASFHDTEAGIIILPTGKGGTSPNEYLDVSITFDSRVQWSSTSYSFDEKLGPATLTLQRTGNSIGAVSVNYATADGTATSTPAPADYTAASGTVTWASGDTAPKTITIPITADALAEGLENFTVTLSGVSAGGVIVNGATATVSIADAGAADPGLNPDYINSGVKQTAIQPDGKLLIAGYFDTIYSNNTGYTRRGLARLNANGTLDLAYGNGAGADVVPIFALALQPDGKAVIGGNFATIHGVARARVARLNADGSLDTTFNAGAGPNAEVHALALQPDGKVLVGGKFTTVAGESHAGIARLKVDGTLDDETPFVGPAFLGFPNADVLSIALQPDGKVILGGSFFFNPAPYKSGVARLKTDGSSDPAFNPGYGAHIANNRDFLQTVQKVALQRDGKVVIGGYFTGFNEVTRNRLARLNSDGTLEGAMDGSFSPAVDPSVAANTPPYPHVRTLLVQPDGFIFVGGSFTQVAGGARANFARLSPTGALDGTFAVGSGSTGWVNDSTAQADGRLVLGTDFGTIQGAASRTIARLFSGLPGLPGTVQFGAPSYVGEEGKPLAVTVTRTAGSYGAISINYGTQPGTAAAARYTPANGTLSWAAGDTSTKTINFTLLNDGAAQPDQTFALNLGIPSGGVISGAPGRTTITVRTPATNVFSNGATLSGVINPNGVATTVWFQYGTSTAYGQTTTPQNIGSGSSNVPFSANLTGLIASKLYHYRLVSSSSAGTVYYADQTFTTARQASEFNGDGNPDYVLPNASNGQVYLFYLNGGAYAGGVPAATVPAGYQLNCAADMNGDGQPDFVLFNPSTRAVLILYLNGPTYAGYAFGPTPPPDWVLVSVADFNNDRKPDYLLYNTVNRQTAIWYLNGATYAGAASGLTVPPALTLLKAADFNGDGKPDYVFFNPSNRQTSVWYLNGVTYAGTGYGPTLPPNWVLSGVADFNADGMNDYVIFNASTRQTYIWFLNGVSYSGAASAPTLPAGFNLASP